MNEALKIQALNALQTMPNVRETDVANILECVQQCYVEFNGQTTAERNFLISELQYFINELRG